MSDPPASTLAYRDKPGLHLGRQAQFLAITSKSHIFKRSTPIAGLAEGSG